MADDRLWYMVSGFVLTSLFMFLILSFVVTVAQDNNKNTTELEEGAFSLDPYEEFLGDVQNRSETFRTRFAEGNIFSIIAGVVVEGIFGIMHSLDLSVRWVL